MAKASFDFVRRVIDIDEQRHVEARRYRELCRQRLPNVPRDWELLTANDLVQSFCDGSGRIRTFRVSDGAETKPDYDGVV